MIIIIKKETKNVFFRCEHNFGREMKTKHFQIKKKTHPTPFLSTRTTGYIDTAIGTLLTKETVRKRIRTENRNYESKNYATSLSIALPECFFLLIHEKYPQQPEIFPPFSSIFFSLCCFIRVLSFSFLRVPYQFALF